MGKDSNAALGWHCSYSRHSLAVQNEFESLCVWLMICTQVRFTIKNVFLNWNNMCVRASVCEPFFFLCCCLLRPLVRFTFLYKVCWLVQHWPKEQSTKRRAVTLFWHPTPNWQTEHGIRGSERQYERRGGKKRGKDKQKGENGVWKNKLQTPSAVHFKKRCHFLSSSTASESCTLIGDKQILKTALSSPSLSYC